MKLNKKSTVSDLFEIVWREHWAQARFKLSGHAKEVKRNYDNHIKKPFGHLPVWALTRQMVRQWHFDRLNIPVTANRSLETLSKMYSFAIEQGLFEGSHPCFSIKAHTERKRRRFATEEEIEKIGHQLRLLEKTEPVQVAFLHTLALSGARPRFIERARRENLTALAEGYGMLALEGKTSADSGEDEVAILPPDIMALIQSLPRRKDGLLFGIKLPRRTWGIIRTNAGCPDLWARDWRRTYASVGLSAGIKIDTIGELLNHKSVQTTKRYALLFDTARIKAAGFIAAKMTALLRGEKVG